MVDLLPAATALVGVFIGAVLTPRATAEQAHRGWLRDKRAATYEKFAEVLQKVEYVVNYDDAINFRLGNEAQDQVIAASIGLDDVTADFNVYASEDIKQQAQVIRRSFWTWHYGVVLRPLTEAERIEYPSDERSFLDDTMVEASPLEDDYPWDEIDAAGKQVLSRMEELLVTIRTELRVDAVPWLERTRRRIIG